MGCCYLLKIALQAWYAYGSPPSNEDTIAGRVYKWIAANLLKIALQAGFTSGLLLSTGDSIAGMVRIWVAAIY